MKRRSITIEPLTPARLRPYGVIIDKSCVRDDRKKNCYGVLLKECSAGWRIGYLIVRERKIMRLEQHPDSLETFEPVKGRCIIALAPQRAPDRVRVFLLDKPVVVKKGIWHDVATLSRYAEVKIFENHDVMVAYHPLATPIAV